MDTRVKRQPLFLSVLEEQQLVGGEIRLLVGVAVRPKWIDYLFFKSA